VSAISLILNILHLIVLSQMKEIKTINYFWILLNISISNIISSCFNFMYFNCQVKQIILQFNTQTTYWLS